MGKDRINPNLGRQGTQIEFCLWVGLIALTTAIGLINTTLFQPQDNPGGQPEKTGWTNGSSAAR